MRVNLQFLVLELFDKLGYCAVFLIGLSCEGRSLIFQGVYLPALLFCLVLELANKSIQISDLLVFVVDLLFAELFCLRLLLLLRLLKLGLHFVDLLDGLLQLLLIVLLHCLSQGLELVSELLFLPLFLLPLFAFLALFLFLLLGLFSLPLSLFSLGLLLGFQHLLGHFFGICFPLGLGLGLSFVILLLLLRSVVHDDFLEAICQLLLHMLPQVVVLGELLHLEAVLSGAWGLQIDHIFTSFAA